MYQWNDELGYYEFIAPSTDEIERNKTASRESDWVRQCLDICDERVNDLVLVEA